MPLIRIKYTLLFVTCLFLLNANAQKTFKIQDFVLESGTKLPEISLQYLTYGNLNQQKNNVIVLPTFFAGSLHSYDKWIGNDKPLNPEKYFIIIPSLISGGNSSSPSNMSPPFNLGKFPVFEIRDNTKIIYSLLKNEWGINKIKAVIGFSMGGMVAFQMAVSYPDFVENIMSLCGTAKTYPHGFIRLESLNSILEASPEFKDGGFDKLSPAIKRAWAAHWNSWLYSQIWWRSIKQPSVSIEEMINNWTKNYSNEDILNQYFLAKTWQLHDIGKTSGFDGNVELALNSIKAKVYYLPGTTDMYFHLGDAEYEAKFIKNLSFLPISSAWGHLAGIGVAPEDNKFIQECINVLLKNSQ